MSFPRRYAAGVLVALSLTISLAGCGGDLQISFTPPTPSQPATSPVLPRPSAPRGPSPYKRLWASAKLPVASVIDASDVEVTDAVTVVSDARSVEAVDTATGRLRWRVDDDEPDRHDPDLELFGDTLAVAGDVVVTSAISDERLGVVALSLRNGTVRWTSFSDTQVGNDMSFVAGASGGVVVWSRSGPQSASETTAVRATDGKRLWRRSGVDAVAVSGSTVVGHPGSEDQEDKPARPLALDLRNGRQRWQARTAGNVEEVSGDWVLVSNDTTATTATVAYALSDGHGVDAGDGQSGWIPTVDQVRPMGNAVVWLTTGSSIDYHVLADGSSSPTTVDVGLQASVVPYTLVGTRLLAGADGTKVALATYDLEGHKTAPDLPGKLIGVYGDHLVLAEGSGAGTYFTVYRISG